MLHQGWHRPRCQLPIQRNHPLPQQPSLNTVGHAAAVGDNLLSHNGQLISTRSSPPTIVAATAAFCAEFAAGCGGGSCDPSSLKSMIRSASLEAEAAEVVVTPSSSLGQPGVVGNVESDVSHCFPDEYVTWVISVRDFLLQVRGRRNSMR